MSHPPPHDDDGDDDGLNFFRACLFAVPVSLMLWAMIGAATWYVITQVAE
jgi:hypothetical protein